VPRRLCAGSPFDGDAGLAERARLFRRPRRHGSPTRGAVTAEASGPVAENVVVLVHGIRTYAPWYPLVERLMRPRRISVHPIRYGRFDLFRFMVPGSWRRGPVAATLRKLDSILLDAAKKSQRVTVIAHSNGFYVATKLLEEKPTIELDYLILCGSVVPNDFDWARVNRQIRNAIVNDYGVRDIWPVVAKSQSWGFGRAGTHGFGAPVVDRIHDLGHDYFTEDFVERFWLPIIESDEIVASTRRGDRLPSISLWFAIGELPWRWAILAAIGVAVALGLATVWPALRSLATGRTPRFVSIGLQNSSMPAPRPSPLQRDALGVTTEFRFSANGSWLPVSLYQGSPRPVFGTDPRAIFSAEEAGEDPSASAGQEGPRFTEAFAMNGVNVLDPGTRSSVMRCLVSVDALARCPVDTKAGAFTAVGSLHQGRVHRRQRPQGAVELVVVQRPDLDPYAAPRKWRGLAAALAEPEPVDDRVVCLSHELEPVPDRLGGERLQLVPDRDLLQAQPVHGHHQGGTGSCPEGLHPAPRLCRGDAPAHGCAQ
jgi:hypothetical protein